MKVVFERYQKPKPQGGEGASWFSLAWIIPIAYCVAVLLTQPVESVVPFMVSIPLASMILLLLKGVYQLWRNSSLRSRLKDNAARDLLDNSSEFYLLLRPFEFDGYLPILPDTSRYLDKYETEHTRLLDYNKNDEHHPMELFDALSEMLLSHGYLVAVGERKPDHVGGPGLVSVEHDDWKLRVASLIADARCIIIMPWPTAGTLWELNEIVTRSMIEKTIFIMPPSYGTHKIRRTVSSSGSMDNVADVDFYYKILADRQDTKHKVQSVEKQYKEAIAVLTRAGLKTPRYDPDGCVFFYKSEVMHTKSIPYFKTQMSEIVNRIDC